MIDNDDEKVKDEYAMQGNAKLIKYKKKQEKRKTHYKDAHKHQLYNRQHL